MNRPKTKVPIKAVLLTSASAALAGLAVVVLLEVFTNVPGRMITALGGAATAAVILAVFPFLRP